MMQHSKTLISKLPKYDRLHTTLLKLHQTNASFWRNMLWLEGNYASGDGWSTCIPSPVYTGATTHNETMKTTNGVWTISLDQIFPSLSCVDQNLVLTGVFSSGTLEYKLNCTGSEAITAVITNRTVLWVEEPFSLEKATHFHGSYHLCLQFSLRNVIYNVLRCLRGNVFSDVLRCLWRVAPSPRKCVLRRVAPSPRVCVLRRVALFPRKCVPRRVNSVSKEICSTCCAASEEMCSPTCCVISDLHSPTIQKATVFLRQILPNIPGPRTDLLSGQYCFTHWQPFLSKRQLKKGRLGELA
jgi:hypothetical protein